MSELLEAEELKDLSPQRDISLNINVLEKLHQEYRDSLKDGSFKLLENLSRNADDKHLNVKDLLLNQELMPIYTRGSLFNRRPLQEIQDSMRNPDNFFLIQVSDFTTFFFLNTMLNNKEIGNSPNYHRQLSKPDREVMALIRTTGGGIDFEKFDEIKNLDALPIQGLQEKFLSEYESLRFLHPELIIPNLHDGPSLDPHCQISPYLPQYEYYQELTTTFEGLNSDVYQSAQVNIAEFNRLVDKGTREDKLTAIDKILRFPQNYLYSIDPNGSREEMIDSFLDKEAKYYIINSLHLPPTYSRQVEADISFSWCNAFTKLYKDDLEFKFLLIDALDKSDNLLIPRVFSTTERLLDKIKLEHEKLLMNLVKDSPESLFYLMDKGIDHLQNYFNAYQSHSTLITLPTFTSVVRAQLKNFADAKGITVPEDKKLPGNTPDDINLLGYYLENPEVFKAYLDPNSKVAAGSYQNIDPVMKDLLNFKFYIDDIVNLFTAITRETELPEGSDELIKNIESLDQETLQELMSYATKYFVTSNEFGISVEESLQNTQRNSVNLEYATREVIKDFLQSSFSHFSRKTMKSIRYDDLNEIVSSLIYKGGVYRD